MKKQLFFIGIFCLTIAYSYSQEPAEGGNCRPGRRVHPGSTPRGSAVSISPRPSPATPRRSLSRVHSDRAAATGPLADRGAVRAFNNRTFDVSKVVPTIVMRNEDFGRICRLLADETPVKLEFDLRSRIVPDGVTSYNVVGEIYGSIPAERNR